MNSILEADRIVRSLSLEDITAGGFILDRVKENPEAARYFLAYGEWMQVSAEEIFNTLDSSVSRDSQVYVDFPFCPTICNFCAFYPVLAKNAEQMKAYVESLKKELTLLRSLYFERGFIVETLELGGGTPTYLPLDLLQDAVVNIFEEFPIKAGGEHNFETTPEAVVGEAGMAKLRFMRDIGFDRISIGAQSFNDAVLKSSNRSHNSEDIYKAYKNARSLGFQRINLDLLLGLSNQTLEDFVQSVEKCIELEADIVEIYTMRYFDTKNPVPLTKRYVDQPSRFLNEYSILTARVAGDLMLKEAGYTSCNGRTYQKQGSTKEYYSDYYKGNFQGSNILGIGRKSFSSLHPWQYANYRNIKKYSAALDSGRLPIAAGWKCNDRALLAKKITGALQIAETIDYAAIKNNFDAGDYSPFDELFGRLIKSGLMTETPDGYQKTFMGFLFIENILKAVYDAGVTPFNINSKFLGKEQTAGKWVEQAAQC